MNRRGPGHRTINIRAFAGGKVVEKNGNDGAETHRKPLESSRSPTIRLTAEFILVDVHLRRMLLASNRSKNTQPTNCDGRSQDEKTGSKQKLVELWDFSRRFSSPEGETPSEHK